MKCDKKAMLLYAVTDRRWTGKQSLYEQVKDALNGGITCLQLREKEMDNQAFLQEAQEIAALCKKFRVPFIINDNVEVALQCGADGIHIGQEDMGAAEVRRLVGDHVILGVSVHTVEEALAAQEAGADYLGVGAMFATATKDDADSVSLQELQAICSAVSIPVVAIGGLNKENIPLLAGTGVDGVALVSAIFAAEDIQAECRKLWQITASTLKPITFRGVIFDFDGTLFDSMSIWETVGVDYLRSQGITPEDDLQEKLKPLSQPESARYFQEHYGLQKSEEEIVAGINHLLEEFYFHQTMPKDGVPEFLKDLSDRGIKMCIATATDRYLVEAALERCNLRQYFLDVITCSDVGAGKTSPAIWQRALALLGTTVEDTAVFEDALYAAKSAKAQGFFVFGVWDQYEREYAEMHTATNYYLNSFTNFTL